MKFARVISVDSGRRQICTRDKARQSLNTELHTVVPLSHLHLELCIMSKRLCRSNKKQLLLIKHAKKIR